MTLLSAVVSRTIRICLDKRNRKAQFRSCLGLSLLLPVSAFAFADPVRFQIPEQPLPQALKAFAEQSKMQLLYRQNTVRRGTAHEVVGNYEPKDALQLLLQGTGLETVYSDADTVTLRPAARSATAPPAAATREPLRLAQQSDPAPQGPQDISAKESAPLQLEEIQVTASRVTRTGFTAPTPTIVVGSELMDVRGASNVATVLYEIPVLRASSPGSQSSTAPGVSFADLRGLGNRRTLVMMDGRRLVPSASVDLNQIPSILISRTEIVTGGASAQWGSDAVAGVVNLITRGDYEGLQTRLQGSSSEYSDYKEVNAGVLYGFNLTDASHLTVAAEYTRNEGTGFFFDRPWGEQEYVLFSNPAPLVNGVPNNGLPLRWIGTDVHLSTMTPGGIITNGPLRGTQFGAGGATSQFNYGQYVGAVNMIGGDGHGDTFGATLKYAAPITRESAFARYQIDVASNTTAFVESLWSYSHVLNSTVTAKDQGPVTANGNATITNPLVIRRDNAFLPESVRAAMVTNNLQFINVGRNSLDLGAMIPDVRNTTLRSAAGLKGSFGQTGNWDMYYQHGLNRYTNNIYNDRIDANWLRAVDAVVVPATGAPAGLTPGSIVCRSTLTNPSNGCVPANIFGAGSISQAAHDYTYGTAWAQTRYVQHTAAANISAEPFDSWAGPISVATGVEYRRESQETISDPISQANGFNIGNVKAIQGDFNVKEAYLETVVPLLSGKMLAKSLDLQLAGRYADYSSIGGATTWKGGLTWDLNDWLRLRATESRDIRAPNIEELFASPFFQTNSVTDPNFAPPANNYLVSLNTVGNVNLQEEQGDTTTAGIVFSPPFVKGLTLSADYFRISIDDAVSVLDRNIVIARCAQGLSEYCPFVVRDPVSGRITSVTLTQINLAELDLKGVDMEVAYRVGLPRGQIALRYLGTYLFDKIVNDTITVVDRAGEIGRNNANNGPRYRSTGTLTYTLGGFSSSVQVNYVSGGPYDATYTALDMLDNHVDSRTYLNLMGSYDLAPGLQIYGVVNNLMNREPPADPNAGGGSSPFDGGLHDVLGRRYILGVRYRP